MIRLTLLLCAMLYFGLMVLGQDHGQKRHGLMLAAAQPELAAVTAPEAQATVFIPAQPTARPVVVISAPQPATQVATELPVGPLTQVSADPAALPAPQIAGGILYTVTAAQANVRDGPGRNFAVMGSVTRGEQVLVVFEDQPLQGWSRIRIEGDGIEGYVSTRLLTPSQ